MAKQYYWNFFQIITTFFRVVKWTNDYNDATIVRFRDHVNAIRISPLGAIIFRHEDTLSFSLPLSDFEQFFSALHRFLCFVRYRENKRFLNKTHTYQMPKCGKRVYGVKIKAEIFPVAFRFFSLLSLKFVFFGPHRILCVCVVNMFLNRTITICTVCKSATGMTLKWCDDVIYMTLVGFLNLNKRYFVSIIIKYRNWNDFVCSVILAFFFGIFVPQFKRCAWYASLLRFYSKSKITHFTDCDLEKVWRICKSLLCCST